MVYTDASCGNFKSERSQGAHISFLMGENDCCNLLSVKTTNTCCTKFIDSRNNGAEAALHMKELFKRAV